MLDSCNKDNSISFVWIPVIPTFCLNYWTHKLNFLLILKSEINDTTNLVMTAHRSKAELHLWREPWSIVSAFKTQKLLFTYVIEP